MSFLGTILDLGKKAIDFVSNNSVASTLLKTVVSGYALNKVTASIGRDNARNNSNAESAPREVRRETPIVNRQQVEASQDNKIPVVYGHAQLTGIVTEARMSSFNTRMTLVYTLSEKTGVKFSDNQDSVFTFNDVYYNDERLKFKGIAAGSTKHGIEAELSFDRDGNENRSVDGVVRVWCYNNGSANPVNIAGFDNNSLPDAWEVVPEWTTAHRMEGLVFAVVQVDYDVSKGSTSIGTFRFDITNSMTLPGDCMFDYMTNTRYGAGIPAEDIYRE